MMCKEELISKIECLNPDLYCNLNKVLQYSTSKDVDIRSAVIKKIGNDFCSRRFRSEKYPLKEMNFFFQRSLLSKNVDVVVNALCFYPDIDLQSARYAALEFIKNTNLSIKTEAICIIGICKNKSDIKLLLNLLDKEQNNLIKSEIFISLLRLECFLVENQIIDFIQFSDENTLAELVIGLSAIIDEYDSELISNALENRKSQCNDQSLRNEINLYFEFLRRKNIKARINILSVENEENVADLIRFFSDKDQHIRYSAIYKFGGGDKPNKNILPAQLFKDEIFNKLKAQMSDESNDVRAEVLSVLGDWKREKDVTFCANFLTDDSEIVRLTAIYSLGEIRNDKAISYLEKFNNNAESNLEKARYYQSLIRLGEKQYFNDWLTLIYDKEAIVRSNIAGGVWSVKSNNNKECISQALIKAMGKEPYIEVYEEMEVALNLLKDID